MLNNNTVSSQLIWSFANSRKLVFGQIDESAFNIRAIYSILSANQRAMDISPIDGKMAVAGGGKRLNVFNASKFKANDIEIRSYKYNIYATVNGLAWHPTKGNLLAFCTNDGAVGTLDPTNPANSPVLLPSCTREPIHHIAWGYMDDANSVQHCVLMVCAANKVMYYKDNKMDNKPGKLFCKFDNYFDYKKIGKVNYRIFRYFT